MLSVFAQIELVRDEVENTPNEIGDHDCDNNEPDNIIHVQYSELIDDRLVIAILILKLFEYSVKAGYIQQLDETGKSTQTKQFGENSGVEEDFEWEDGDKIDEEPSTDVIKSNLFQILDGLKCVWIRVGLKKVEDEIEVKHELDGLIKGDLQATLRLSKSHI